VNELSQIDEKIAQQAVPALARDGADQSQRLQQTCKKKKTQRKAKQRSLLVWLYRLPSTAISFPACADRWRV
jgi:hypothetical protein